MKMDRVSWRSRLSIVDGLRAAFLLSAVLTLLVSGIALFSWYLQSSHIRSTIDEALPKVQFSFNMESHLNVLLDQMNSFLQVESTARRLAVYHAITDHLADMQKQIALLPEEEQPTLHTILRNSQTLVDELNQAVSHFLTSKEQLSQLALQTDWLHDDFANEFDALEQDLNWQQASLLEKFNNSRSAASAEQIKPLLHQVQQDLALLFHLSYIEKQLMDHLNDALNEERIMMSIMTMPSQELQYLAQDYTNTLKHISPQISTIGLTQTFNSLMALGEHIDKIPQAQLNYRQANVAYQLALNHKDRVLGYFHQQISKQLQVSHSQLQQMDQRLQHIMSLSGILILMISLVAIVFLVLINYYYIRHHLLKRFKQLNQLITDFPRAFSQPESSIQGHDEIARIAQLLTHSLQALHEHQRQLNKEIQERILIEKNLRDTQDELIQSAKLAVVGQTMTALAHEINQPLNALSLYIYSLRQLMPIEVDAQCMTTLNKMGQLVERIDHIIKRIRQLSRRRDTPLTCVPINLGKILQNTWDEMNMQYQQRGKCLTLPANLVANSAGEWPNYQPALCGDELIVQQVLTNIFSNAFEAQKNEVIIRVDMVRYPTYWQVDIEDNGSGWLLTMADTLAKPFFTSKPFGLGIGLALSKKLMQQMGGELFMASSLHKHALIVLQFPIEES